MKALILSFVLLQLWTSSGKLSINFWTSLMLTYTTDFSGKVGLNLPFGLVTSCCNHQTA